MSEESEDLDNQIRKGNEQLEEKRREQQIIEEIPQLTKEQLERSRPRRPKTIEQQFEEAKKQLLDSVMADVLIYCNKWKSLIEQKAVEKHPTTGVSHLKVSE
jgi:F0F1-type ATP synthase membrane subunit b/b'